MKMNDSSPVNDCHQHFCLNTALLQASDALTPTNTTTGIMIIK